MADPVAKADLKVAKKAIAFVERFIGQGGVVVPEGMDDLQKLIDEPALMDHMVRWARAGFPAMSQALPVPIVVPSDSESQKHCRALLGSDFVGLDIALRVYKHLLIDAHVTALNDIRLFDEKKDAFESVDDSMDILREIAKGKRKQFLFPLLPVSVPELHAVDPDRFYNDRTPWFYEQSQRDAWSNKGPQFARWCLMDADIFPGSLSIDVQAQEKHIPATCPGYRLTLPWEYVPGALLLQTATKRKIGGNKWVRFFVRAAGGFWVSAYWCVGRLRVFCLFGDAIDFVGGCALRASSEP